MFAGFCDSKSMMHDAFAVQPVGSGKSQHQFKKKTHPAEEKDGVDSSR